jgi:hypothetical protein
MPSIFASRCSVWPKNAYIKTPLDDRKMRHRRNTKHRNKGCSSEDWRGNAAEVAPGCFSTLSDVNTIITVIRLKRIYNFWCSMLVYTPFALCFVYNSWRFYAFSGTNILTRCHSASSLFSAVIVFQKSYIGIFLKLDGTKAEVPNYLTRRRSPKERRRRTRGRPHLLVAWATPRPRHQGVWPPGPPPDISLPPINSSRRENPKGPNSFPENILEATAIVDAGSGGSRSSSRHPAGEGNHHRRPSSSRCLPLEWCVSSLSWTTGP